MLNVILIKKKFIVSKTNFEDIDPINNTRFNRTLIDRNFISIDWWKGTKRFIIFPRHTNNMHRNDVINNLSQFFVTRASGEPVFYTENHKILVMRTRFSSPSVVSACFTPFVGNDVEGFALLWNVNDDWRLRNSRFFNRNVLRVAVRIVGGNRPKWTIRRTINRRAQSSAITVVFDGSWKRSNTNKLMASCPDTGPGRRVFFSLAGRACLPAKYELFR